MGGIGQNLIARLSPDGSVDTRFDAGFGLAGNGSRAESVAIGQDGSIFLTGSILSYDDTTINDVVVLNGDRVPLAFAARPFAVDVAPGGSIVLRATGVGTSAVGYRWLNNGVPLSNGGDISGATSDTLTIANADLTDADTYTVEITNLSGTLAADAVVTVLGAPLIREDPLGGTFAVSSTINLHVEVVGVPTLVYEWYVGGTQLTNGGNVSGADTATLTLTNVQKADSGSYTVKVTNGQGFDESAAAVVNVILPPAGFYAGFPVAAGANTRIRAVLPSDGDQVFIGGAFSLAGPTGFNTSAVRFALLKNDGTVDTSVSSLSPNSDVYDLAYHGTDGLLIGGGFTTIGGASRAYLARFTALGPDTTFNTNLGTGPNSTVLQVLVQPDDKVLVAGYFSSASGATRYGIARYNADGTLDTDFNPSMPNFAQVNAMALGANGKITISGFFNLSGRQNIARLNGNGTLDTTFNATLDSAAQSLILQPDGKVIAGGYFGTVNGQAGFGTLARLNVNGSTDSGFPAAVPFSGTINTMAIQSNGRILVGGNFTGYGGSGAGLVRLEPNGLVDSTFATGTGWPSFADVHDIVIRDDGVIWVGANGIQFNGQTVNYLAAFNGDEPAVGTTFASWVIANMLPAGKDGPLDDVDLDGVSNLLEYALGLDPKISDANGMPQAVEAAGQLTLTYRRIRTDVTYSAETTTDLANPASWSVIGVDQGSPGPDGTTTASIPISGLNGFLRVKVVQIP